MLPGLVADVDLKVRVRQDIQLQDPGHVRVAAASGDTVEEELVFVRVQMLHVWRFDLW